MNWKRQSSLSQSAMDYLVFHKFGHVRLIFTVFLKLHPTYSSIFECKFIFINFFSLPFCVYNDVEASDGLKVVLVPEFFEDISMVSDRIYAFKT